MAAIVISIFNQKGGAGKSTVAMNLGGTLGLRGHRVLVADMDPKELQLAGIVIPQMRSRFPQKLLISPRRVKKHTEQ